MRGCIPKDIAKFKTSFGTYVILINLAAGHGRLQGCETSRKFPSNILDNRLTDGGEVDSLMRQPSFTPQEDFRYSFLLEAESAPGPDAAGRIRSIEKSN
jgi:hypothetical protein